MTPTAQVPNHPWWCRFVRRIGPHIHGYEPEQAESCQRVRYPAMMYRTLG